LTLHRIKLRWIHHAVFFVLSANLLHTHTPPNHQ